MAGLAGADRDLASRLLRLRRTGRAVRACEVHLTNACNIRCRGCWFFAFDVDRETSEAREPAAWRAFAQRQADAGITAALLIGGEPTLVPERIGAFVDCMPYVTISTNGLVALPRAGFENVAVAVTLFGGGPLDDELRGVKPNGRRFAGLFDRALRNYAGDLRATFVYALCAEGIDQIEPTVRRIADNGNAVTFNYYSRHGEDDPLAGENEARLLDEALRVRDRFPEAVVCHPHFIRTLITGRTEWGRFGYEVCPSISTDHAAHAERLRNGNPVLPRFNTWAADLETVAFCCTSGHCEGCRDSQAIYSWLLANARRYLDAPERLRTWVEVAESYWCQFVWSDYHRAARAA